MTKPRGLDADDLRLGDDSWWRAPENWIIGVCVLLLAYLALVPLVFLTVASFRTGLEDGAWTWDHYVATLGDSYLLTLLRNTSVFAIATTACSVTLGGVLAWAVERTDTPFKRTILVLTLLPVAIPNLLFVISWVLLASPNIGLLNAWATRGLGITEPIVNIFSMPGMVWVETINMVPLAFLLMLAAFKGMDPALEESARMSGAGPLRTIRTITVPLVRPGLIAVGLLIFVRAFEAFETPAILGIPVRINVFTSEIYVALRTFPPNLGRAATYSTFLIVVTAVLLALHNRATRGTRRYQTITGKGFRPEPAKLGRWRYVPAALGLSYFFVAAVLPALVLIWASLQPILVPPSVEAIADISLDNFREVFRFPRMLRAAGNSLILAAGSATIVIFTTAVVSWVILRTRRRGRNLLDALTFAPIVFPGIVLGTALLITYLWLPVPIYGTLVILLVAYVTKFMPYGIRYNRAGMSQIHTELEESAKMSGASWWRMLTRVTFPLLLPAMTAGWLYIFILGTRELGSSILLYAPGTEVISIVIWDMWSGGRVGAVAALGVMYVSAILLVLIPLRAVTRRYGVGGGGT